MKASVFKLHCLHHFTAYSLAVITRLNQHMRIIDHQKSIRNRISQTPQFPPGTGRHQRVGVAQCGQQLLGFVGRRPFILETAVEREKDR